MPIRLHLWRTALLALLLPLASISPSFGQQVTDTAGAQEVMAELSPEQLHEKASGLLVRIRAAAEDADRYQAKLENAT